MEDRFGEDVAATYDEDDGGNPAETLDPAVDVLADLAGDGPALEFASGTGRVTLPLAARGVDVAGIELSAAMTRRLKAKPGGDAVPITIGDMATTRVPGEFALVFLVCNTVVNLTTQDAQVACFANAAAHLRPGGRFVVEVGVPDLRALGHDARHAVFTATEDHWGIDEVDVATQAMWSHHLRRRGGVWEQRSIPFRYVWPSELDLMARLAGLRLEHRWADWRGAPFDARATKHVSVWVRPSTP